MITKYKVGGSYSNKIEKIEVEKETECFVTLKSGRREAKSSDYSNWFDTELQAKQFIYGRMDSKRESIRRHIDQYKKELKAVDEKILQYLEDNPELVVGD